MIANISFAVRFFFESMPNSNREDDATMRMAQDIECAAAKEQKKQNKLRAKEEKEKFRTRSIALKELHARKGQY